MGIQKEDVRRIYRRLGRVESIVGADAPHVPGPGRDLLRRVAELEEQVARNRVFGALDRQESVRGPGELEINHGPHDNRVVFSDERPNRYPGVASVTLCSRDGSETRSEAFSEDDVRSLHEWSGRLLASIESGLVAERKGKG